MVAKVRNLTSSSSMAEYFRKEGGYYVAAGGDREAARAKAAEHREASAWHGEGAAALGLEAGRKVSAATFETILRGHVPGTNIRLGRKRDGEHEHRPGFDITFSAPKSVSLAALLPTPKHPRGDRGVLRCHDEAVKATLDWIEETLLQTRGYDPATGRRPRIAGHGMAAALFRHIASRNLDPQLHTHAVIANMTRDGAGRWKSIEPTGLHRNATLIGAYYRDQLARRLIGRGYAILPAMAGRLRSFEIAGYDRRVRDAFSTRRKQMEAWMDERGWDHGQAAAQIVALATRKRKAEPLHAMLRTIWAARAGELGRVPVVRRSRPTVSPPAVPSALKVAWQAMRHLEERQSVFAAGQLEALALGHPPGRHTCSGVSAPRSTARFGRSRAAALSSGPGAAGAAGTPSATITAASMHADRGTTPQPNSRRSRGRSYSNSAFSDAPRLRARERPSAAARPTGFRGRMCASPGGAQAAGGTCRRGR